MLKDIGEKNLKKSPFTISDLFPETLGKSYYIQDDECSIQTERLPSDFEEKYSKFFKLLGLNINDELANLRKEIINKNKDDWSKVRKLETEEIINTIEYIAYQKKEYKNKETEVLKNIFKALSEDKKTHLEYLPCMKNLSTIVLKKIHPYGIYCITKERMVSKNKFFRERLSKEIKNRDIVYLDILDLDIIPDDWEEIKENNDELKKEKEKEIVKKDKNISMHMSQAEEGSKEFNWYIGWKGEKYVYLLLLEKFKNTDLEVVWHNEDSNSIEDDKGSIDIEIKDTKGNTVHNVEVKTTIKSSSQNQTLAFYMSSEQFDAATSWGRDTHLIFVTGIEDNDPKCLYMNFDNEWLKTLNDDMNDISKQYDSHRKKVQGNKTNPFFDAYVKEYGDPSW